MQRNKTFGCVFPALCHGLLASLVEATLCQDGFLLYLVLTCLLSAVLKITIVELLNLCFTLL
jgi:hypothetical protein